MKFTPEQVIEMAREAGVPDLWLATISDAGYEALCRCASVVADRALEAAAAGACEQTDEDGEGPDSWGWHAKDYAKAIRAMKEHQ
jgi:hypothetical protein